VARYRSGLDLEASEEGRALLQRRVAGFGFVAGATLFAFYVYRLIGCAMTELARALDAEMNAHFAGGLFFFGMWLVCRTGRRSPRFVRTVESVGVVGGSVCFEIMGMTINPGRAPEMIVLMALTFVLFSRAVLVPSTPRRTTILGVVIGIPLLAMAYLIYSNFDREVLAAIEPSAIDITGRQLGMSLVVWTGIWWAMSVGVCRLAARVIFGLRVENRDFRRLGQYTLQKKLGEGGMGAVYSASHAMLKRPTAIKLLPPDKMGERALERFEREVQRTAQLTHPNTVRIFDYGRTLDGIFYYAMELLDGPTLDDIVAFSGPLPPARVAHILAQAAGALAEAHGMGLIHRDIKPANIMLVEQGGVPDVTKVLDFGLVKDANPDSDTDATQADAVIGTPQYMCPEAITAPETVDARSDLYALGAVGYFLLTGEHVFSAKTLVAMCTEHLHSVPVSPSERLGKPLPEDLEQLLLRCLEKDPNHRPESARAFHDAVRACAGVGSWTEAEARAWWDEFGEGVHSLRTARAVSATGKTVDVGRAPMS